MFFGLGSRLTLQPRERESFLPAVLSSPFGRGEKSRLLKFIGCESARAICSSQAPLRGYIMIRCVVKSWYIRSQRTLRGV